MELREILKYEWTSYNFFLYIDTHRRAEGPNDFHTANIVLSVS